MILPKCPHCGSENDGVYVNNRWHGWAQTYYDSSGELLETNIDNLRSTDSKTVRCSSCYKVRRDVVIDVNRILVAHSRNPNR